MEKPQVTEIQVRIDCNGCVLKIKKALNGIKGIHDIYIDIPQQKLTVIGWADPEKIVKALKRTRKAATICSETEPPPTTEPPSDDGAPPPAEPVPPPEPVEPPKEPGNLHPDARINQPPPPPPAAAQEPPSRDSTPRQPPQDAGEVHVVHHYPPDRHSHERIYNASVKHYSSTSPSTPVYKNEPPQPVHVNHRYNTYKPTPYVTGYEYIRPPPQYSNYSRPEPPQPSTHYSKPEPPSEHTHYTRSEPPHERYTHYRRPEPPPEYTHYRPEPPQPFTDYRRSEPPPRYSHYSEDYHGSSNGNGNITSIFSDDNPNACTIV